MRLPKTSIAVALLALFLLILGTGCHSSSGGSPADDIFDSGDEETVGTGPDGTGDDNGDGDDTGDDDGNDTGDGDDETGDEPDDPADDDETGDDPADDDETGDDPGDPADDEADDDESGD